MTPRTPEDDEHLRDCTGDAAVDWYWDAPMSYGIQPPVDYPLPLFVPTKGLRVSGAWVILMASLVLPIAALIWWAIR